MAPYNDATFAEAYLRDLRWVLSGLKPAAIGQAIGWLRETRHYRRTVFTCGNGGSASIAAQMIVDLVKGGSYGKSKRFRAICLSDSIATVTAYANDVGYEVVFEEQLKNFVQSGDVLIAISGSGNSPNVLRAVAFANSVGCRTIGLTTGQGGRLKELAQLPLVVPSSHMGRLEDCFFVITHILCYAFMERDD